MDSSPRSTPSRAEWHRIVRSSLGRAALSIVLFLGVVGLLGFFARGFLDVGSEWVVSRFGYTGMAFVVFATEAFCLPLPTDLFLVALASSDAGLESYGVGACLGIASVAGGTTAYTLGSRLGKLRWVERLLKLLSARDRAAIARYGAWALALAALTPMPYCLACWFVGTLGMPTRQFWLVSPLRVIRFVLYLALIQLLV